jgi:hypothetical protein
MVLVVTLAVFTALNLYQKAGERLESAGDKLSGRLEDEMYQPLLSFSLENGDLYLLIYPLKSLYVNKILYLTNNSINIIDVNKAINNFTKIMIKRNYNCTPMKIIVVTGNGAFIHYSPFKDPAISNILESDPSLLDGILKDTYFNACAITSLASASSASAMSSQQVVIEEGSTGTAVSALVVGDPPRAMLVKGNPKDYIEIALSIRGDLWKSSADLEFSLLDPSGAVVYSVRLSASASLSQPYFDVSEATLGSIVGDQGQQVDLVARLVCSPAACVAGVVFNSTTHSTIHLGSTSVYVTSSYSSALSQCPYSRSELVSPVVLGDVSDYDGFVSVSCRESYGIHVSMEGVVAGSFVTDGPLALLYSTSIVRNLDAKVVIDLKETVEVAYDSAPRARVPVDGPVEYWRSSRQYAPSGGYYSITLYDTLALFLSNPQRAPLLIAETSGGTVVRAITAEPRVLPLPEANYSVELPLEPRLPELTVPTVTNYTVSQWDSTKKYDWNVESTAGVLNPLSVAPEVVHVRALGTGKSVVVVLPATAPVVLGQLGRVYGALASTIGGLEVTILSPSAASHVFYVAELAGGLDGVEYTYNESSWSTLTLDNGSFTPPSRPGVFIILAVPTIPEADPLSYQATLIINY